jgi:hypothetical protein
MLVLWNASPRQRNRSVHLMFMIFWVVKVTPVGGPVDARLPYEDAFEAAASRRFIAAR